MSVSTKTRFEVFKRDRFICQYCGRTPPEVLLHVDHIVPKADGGPDDIENLTTACKDCNLGKGARRLEAAGRPAVTQATVDDLRERIEQAQAYAELLAASSNIKRQLDDQLHDLVTAAWAKAWGGSLEERTDGAYWSMPEGGYWPEWKSVRVILRRLSLERVYDAIEITASRFPSKASYDSTRYFYGVCWSMIREQEGRER